MTNRFRYIILVVTFMLGLAIIIKSPLLPASDSEFDLIFKFGVKGPNPEPKNVLNTIKDTFTKDMVIDPSITVKLRLTQEDLERIYKKMVEIGFFEYPSHFKVKVPLGESICNVTPYSSYYFEVISNRVTIKKLWWDDEICNENEKAESLKDLIRLIIEIIESKPEYKKLPKPRAGYI